jgi:formamidase
MHSVRIDRGKRLAHEPRLGHNRFHPDIAPIVEVGEGEEVALETRDVLDGQIKPGTTVADFPSLDVQAPRLLFD